MLRLCNVVEQKKKVLAAITGVTDRSFLFVNSQLVESEIIEFSLNMDVKCILCH